MINRNQGKAGFSVSVFSFSFLQIVVDHFVFFCFNVPCISTENKTGVPCLFFVYLNKRIFFVTHAHEKLNELHICSCFITVFAYYWYFFLNQSSEAWFWAKRRTTLILVNILKIVHGKTNRSLLVTHSRWLVSNAIFFHSPAVLDIFSVYHGGLC